MLWLSAVSSFLALISLPTNLVTSAYFLRYAGLTSVAGRRPGAAALGLLHAGLGLEAAIFLATQATLMGAAFEDAATLLARTLLFRGSTLIGLLAWLSLRRRGR